MFSYLISVRICESYNLGRGLIMSSTYDFDEITEFSKISTVSSIWSNNPITRCMHHNGIPLLCNVVLRRSRVSYLPYNLRWNLHWMSQFFFCQTQTKKKSKFDMIEFAISYDRNAQGKKIFSINRGDIRFRYYWIIGEMWNSISWYATCLSS